MAGSRAQKRRGGDLEQTPFEGLICFNFYRGWRAVQEYYASAFPDEINSQRMYVLGLCEGGATVSEIARKLQIDDAAVSNLLRRMIADQLLTKMRSASDARSFEFHPSPIGKKLRAEVKRCLLQLDEVLYREISPADREVLNRIARTIQKHT